jgi:hypothetical protein
MELFLPVPGYEGRYEASSLGRIKSLPNKVRKTEIFLKFSTHPRTGYFLANLTNHNGKRWVQKAFWVARLIALTFHGPCPPGMEACHGDGVKTNNASNNLRWDTPTANQADRALHGTSNKGSQNPRAKLIESQVKEIKVRLFSGERPETIAPDYLVAVRTIMGIKNGYNWDHIHV